MSPEQPNSDAPNVPSERGQSINWQAELDGINAILGSENISPILRISLEQTRDTLIATLETSKSDRSMLLAANTAYNPLAQAWNWVGDAWTHGVDQATEINRIRVAREREIAAKRFSENVDTVVEVVQ